LRLGLFYLTFFAVPLSKNKNCLSAIHYYIHAFSCVKQFFEFVAILCMLFGEMAREKGKAMDSRPHDNDKYAHHPPIRWCVGNEYCDKRTGHPRLCRNFGKT